jgi:hypothetical protein
MYVPKLVPPAFTVARWVFARALGAVFFCAFASLLPQIRGLIGAHGIVPAESSLAAVWNHLGAEALWKFPTLAWINASNGTLTGLAVAGLVLSLVMMAGIMPGGCSLALWTIYLSFASISSPFLDFKWDSLLLETSLLASLYLPWKLRPDWDTPGPLPRFSRWLLWWLLFRLVFESGLLKLIGGDVNWQNLSALDFYFATQQLPVWTAWYVAQAPRWLLHGMAAIVLFIELGVPFLVVTPRRWRHIGAWILITYQVLIFLTGNYGFLNFLTIALCLLLFDDKAWPRWFREHIVPPVYFSTAPASPPQVWTCGVVASIIGLLALPPFFLSAFHPGQQSENPLARLRSFNSYGISYGVSTERPEIVIEGSNDGAVWQAYEFPWKPSALNTAPAWVAPHQPRLDWQMWIAARSLPERNPWFAQLLGGILAGEPDVLQLLKANPFPGKPPQQVRAVLYTYRFSKPGAADWWQREARGLYHAPVSITPIASAGGDR